jgi:hypothetical protein
MVYMEQIPKTAIRGEAEVKWSHNPGSDDGVLYLPNSLIGKKVSFIIIPEEDQ